MTTDQGAGEYPAGREGPHSGASGASSSLRMWCSTHGTSRMWVLSTSDVAVQKKVCEYTDRDFVGDGASPTPRVATRST